MCNFNPVMSVTSAAWPHHHVTPASKLAAPEATGSASNGSARNDPSDTPAMAGYAGTTTHGRGCNVGHATASGAPGIVVTRGVIG